MGGGFIIIIIVYLFSAKKLLTNLFSHNIYKNMQCNKKQRCLSPACIASSPVQNVMNECYSPACRAKNKDKKQRTHAYFYEEDKQIVNGKVVKDSAIEHYIANPVSNIGLLERLSTDFNITNKRKHKHHSKKHKHKKHKHTHHNKKHTHKKHTHKKHTHKNHI